MVCPAQAALLLFLAAGPPPLLAPSSDAAPAGEGAQTWVDGSARSPGDGSRARPFASLHDALATARERPCTIRLAAGLYLGPFELPPGVRLLGAAPVVLHAEGAAVVHAPLGASLEGLMVQGAAVGLVANGPVLLRGVKFSGQRDTALRVEGGALRALDCEFAASMSQTRAVVVARGASAELVGGAVLGPFRRGVEAISAEVTIDGMRFFGPVVGVHQTGGRVRVSRSDFSGGRGPALFATGVLSLKRVSVLGHEYGLQTGQGAQVEVSDFISVRAERAALALVGTTGRLDDVVALESGSFGGVQLLGSDTAIRRMRIHSPLASALLVRLGRASVEDLVITAVRAEAEAGQDSSGGDAVVVRGAEARISGLTVVGAEGSGVMVAAEAHVQLLSAVLDGCRWGGVVADQGAHLDAVSLLVRRSAGPAVLLTGRAVVRADLLRAEDGTGELVEADCERGAQALLSRERGGRPLPASPCIGRWLRGRAP